MTPRPVPVGPGPQEKRRPFHLVVRLGIPDRAVERAGLPVLFTQQSSRDNFRVIVGALLTHGEEADRRGVRRNF